MKILNQLLGFSKRGHAVSAQISWIYTGLGNKDKAFAWLERGVNERNSQLEFLRVEPMWDNLRSDSRFADLLKEIGLDK